MSSLTGVESAVLAFDAVQSELAIATGDGRVRLFSVAQQRLTADITQALTAAAGSQVATEIYSCMAWGKGTDSKQRLLFLGTTAGVVRCYDATRGEVRWSAAGAVDGPVAAVAAAPDASGALLVVGATGGAAVLDGATGGGRSRWAASRAALSAGALLPGGAALIAGASLALHDAGSGARLHKWTGHATPVTALAATADGSFVASAAAGERGVAVWSTATTPGGKLLHKSAVARLSLEEAAAGVAVGAVPGGAFHAAVVTASGALRLFEVAPAADGGDAAARRWGASAPGGGRVLAAVFEAADPAGANLLLAVGSTAKPAFQKERVEAGDGAAVVAVAVPDGGALLQGRADADKRAGAGAALAAAAVGPGEGVLLAGKGAKRGAPGNDVDMSEGDASAGEEGEEEGPTFAERIAALQEGEAAGAPAPRPPPPEGPLKADSLAVLLSQAVQSGDKVLLERVLGVRSEEVIAKTVRRLPPGDAAAFLRAAVARLQSSPARGEQLAAWIRAVLLHHTGYLAGVGGAAGTLGFLYQLIEARLASYQPLLALSGRLDLVLANAARAAGGGDDDDGGAAAGPLVAVEVGSDGGVEVEDAFAAAGLSDDDGDDSLGDYDSGDSGGEDNDSESDEY